MEPEVRENYRVVITAWVIVLLGLGELYQLNTRCIAVIIALFQDV